jgi:hypothetical protein
MKLLSFPRSLSLISVLGVLSFINGCSGSMNLPDTNTDDPLSDAAPGVHGGVYGGQQPIVGAHVFIFGYTPSTTDGYGTVVPASLIGTGSYSGANSGSINVLSTLDPNGACKPGSTAHTGVILPLVYVSLTTTPTRTGYCYFQTGGSAGTATADPSPIYSGGPTLGAGEFYLNNLYQCTSANEYIWLVSISGYPTTPANGGGGVPTSGTTAAALNPYAGLTAALGKCSGAGATVDSNSYVYMNELSTTAMAYALTGFAGLPSSGATSATQIQISSPSSNQVGFANAFANAQQLYNVTGLNNPGDLSAPHTTTSGTGVPPYYLINTVGNMLAYCINQPNSGSGIPTACSNLFSDANLTQTAPNPYDTGLAAFAIAKNAASLPGSSSGNANLLNLATSSGQWSPNNTSSGHPSFNDLSAAITYKIPGPGGSSVVPAGIAVDSNGNAYTGASTASGYLIKISPVGGITTSSALSTIVSPSSVAVASNGTIWTDGQTNGDLYYVSSTSAFTSVTDEGAGKLASGIAHPVATDTSGYAYYADKTNNRIVITNGVTSTSITDANITTGQDCLTGVNNIALDATGELWVTSIPGTPFTGYVVCRISNGGTFSTGLQFDQDPPDLTNAEAVAVDNANDAWIVSNKGSVYSISEITPSTTPVTNSFTGAGLNKPTSIIVDGASAGAFHVFVTNAGTSGSGSISVFGSDGTAITGGGATSNVGLQNGVVINPAGVAVDISGDVWVANAGAASVLELIGIANPTAPLSAMKPGTLP